MKPVMDSANCPIEKRHWCHYREQFTKAPPLKRLPNHLANARYVTMRIKTNVVREYVTIEAKLERTR